MAWQRSMELAVDLHHVVSNLPPHEKYALGNQIRRAAQSVPLNIAEGVARNTPKDIARFLTIAIGSLSELDSQLKLSWMLGYLSHDDSTKLCQRVDEIKAMLFVFRRKVLSE